MSINQKETLIREIGVYEATTYHASGHHHFAQVGEKFAKQYYMSLCLNPQNTCNFYNEESTMSRPGDNGTRSITTLKEIENEILHSDMTKSAIFLLAIHSQETIAESIIVGVTGLFQKDGMLTRFHQKFFLVPQAGKLLVQNDFLRFIDTNNTPTDIESNEASMKESGIYRGQDADVNQTSATISPATTHTSTSTRLIDVAVKKIVLKNLPPNVTRNSIIHALKDFGAVHFYNVQIRGHNDGYLYALVEFNNPRAAKQAVQVGSINIDGYECIVELKKSHTEGL